MSSTRSPHAAAAAMAVLAIGLIVSSVARAQNVDTWDGGGGDDNWGTGNNWVDNSSPSLNSQIHFAGSTRTTPFYNYGSFDAMYRIFFNSGASSFTLNGNSIKLADFGGNVPKVENNSTNKQTLQFANFAWNSSGEINPVNGDIDINLGGGSGSMFLDNSTELRVFGNNGKVLTFLSPIKNGNAAGSFNLKQASEVVFSAANTYTGDTTIEAGTLSYSAGGSTASGFHRLGADGSGTAATLRITDSDGGTTMGNGIVVRAGAGARRIQATNTSGTNTYGGNIFLDGNAETSSASGGTVSFTGATFDLKNQTVTVSGSGNTVFSNGLKNPTGGQTGNVIKTGSGIAYTDSTSTYRGTTTVNGGTLVIRGTLDNSGGAVTVGNGSPGTGALAGNGSIHRNVSISNGGTVAPGSSAFNMAALSINSTGTTTTFAGGGAYSWEVNALPGSGTAGTNWDTLSLNALSVTATSGSKFTLKVTSLNAGGNAAGSLSGLSGAPGTQYVWKIATANGAVSIDPSVFDIDASAFTADAGGNWSIAGNGNDVELTLTIVPEPGTGALLLSALGFTSRSARRRGRVRRGHVAGRQKAVGR